VIGALTLLVLLAALGLLWLRRPFLFILTFAILFSLTYRFVSVAYLDARGPVYSVQLFRDLGPGSATIPLLVAALVYLSAFLIVFSPRRLQYLGALCDRLAATGDVREDRLISHGWMAVSLLFVVLLYVDFMRIGVIPLIDGVERYDYTASYGGRWHLLLMNYGMLWVFMLGVFYIRGLFARGRTDDRFLLLLLATLVYLLLAGHRFSAFYVYVTFFFSPYGILYLWTRHGIGPAPDALLRLRRRTRLALGAAAVAAVVMVSIGLYRSYFITRDMGKADPAEEIVHRVLVQPGELWYATWERVFVRREIEPAVFDRLFVNPITTLKRNTTIPYLMVAEIGDEAYPMVDEGLGYGGGYPEVFFELLGRFGAYAGVFLAALATAGLYVVVVQAMLERRYVRLALGWYVLFAFVNIVFGGMLNFLVNWIFWLKVLALIGWIAFERERERTGFRGDEASQPV